MVDFWLIFAFIGGCLASLALLYGFNWAVEKRATSITNAKYAKIGNEKKALIKGERGEMLLKLKGVLDEEGDIKEKLGKIVGVASEHPEATEDLFKQLRRFI